MIPIRNWFGQPAWFGWTRVEWLLYVLLVFLAAVLRFFDLGIRTFHHDEAIHAKEAYDILNGKQFRYNPAYHGPLLYFANVALFLVFGTSEVLARVIPASFGVGAVAAILLFRPEIGRTGTPLAMGAMASSTAFLYYSRFLRNDIYVAVFTLVLVAAVVRYVHNPRPGWIYLAWIALAFSLATKENAFIHGFALVVVLLVLTGVGLVGLRRGSIATGPLSQVSRAIMALGRDAEHLVYGALVFVMIVFVFYTSFFTHLAGFRDAFTRSIEYWTGVHASERVNQPWFYYAMFLIMYEPFALVFGVIALLPTRRWWSPFHLILGVWIVVTGFVYSVAGEKAPWLVLHVLWGPLLLASWWVGRWFDTKNSSIQRLTIGLLSGGLLAWTVWFAIPINFQRGDTPNDFVVYVQSSPDVLEATTVVHQAAERSGKGLGLRVVVNNEFAWPVVWYLRDYTNVLYTKDVSIQNAREADVLFMTPAEADSLGIELPEHVGRQMVLRWWFPEFAYKAWDSGFLANFVRDQEARSSFWNWLVRREVTPVPIGTFDFVMYVRTDLLATGSLGPFRL